MKIIPTIALFTATIFLCGCPTMRPQNLARPEQFTSSGTFVHQGSKIKFPATIAGFQREKIHRYDADGLDIGVGYNFIDGHQFLTATVYVYPAPSLVSIASPPAVVADAREHLTKGEFDRRKQEIQRGHSDVKLLEQRDMVRTENGRSFPGKAAIYEYQEVFAGVRQPLRSHLYVFCYVGDKWAIQYRFTAPKGMDSDRQIQEFMQQWNWLSAE